MYLTKKDQGLCHNCCKSNGGKKNKKRKQHEKKDESTDNNHMSTGSVDRRLILKNEYNSFMDHGLAGSTF